MARENCKITLRTSCHRRDPTGEQNMLKSLLGGSGVVISRVISRVTILITHIQGLITPLITTPEPPSKDL